jgi:hypothetical protein
MSVWLPKSCVHRLPRPMCQKHFAVWTFIVLKLASLKKENKLDFLSSHKFQHFPCVVKFSLKMLLALLSLMNENKYYNDLYTLMH